LSRYTQPEAEQKVLLEKLKLKLPAQPPPKIAAAQVQKFRQMKPCSADF
jgi:hypothetical protein